MKNIYKYNSINNDSLNELTVIYASALEVDKNNLKVIINSIMSNRSEDISYFSNTEYIYMNNYLAYISILSKITNDALHIANRHISSFDLNNSDSDGSNGGGNDFFGGGDFTGGGGGDSGAF